jgi:hypothetical protein
MYIHGESSQEMPETITVSGYGRVYAAPDVAEITFGVQTGRQPTSQAAIEVLEENMNSIISAVQEAGVKAEDVSTEYLWLNPAYDWVDGQQINRGYEANQSLRVTVRDTEKVSSILGTATSAGANQVNGVNFTIDDFDALRSQAREQAITKAKQKGGEIASSLGVSLGEITGFSEGSPSMGYNEYAMMGGAGGMGGGGEVPVPGGQQEVTSTVYLTFEIE